MGPNLPILDAPSQPDRYTYVRHTASRVWENLPGVLFAGIVFGVFSLPTLVLLMVGALGPALLAVPLLAAPALLAMLAQEGAFVQDRTAPVRDMPRAVCHFWGRSARLGALICFPIVAAIFTSPALSRPDPPAIVWIGLGADLLGLLVTVTLSLYAAPLMVLDDRALMPALRDALILASRHLVNTFGLLAMGLLFMLLIVYGSFALIFVLPAIWGMFVVNNCRLVAGEELAAS